MNQKLTITPDTTLIRDEDSPSADLDDELVLMSIENAKYYGMNVTSRKVWEILAEPHSVNQVCEKLQTVFEVDPQTCQVEVLAFAQELVDANLARVVEA